MPCNSNLYGVRCALIRITNFKNKNKMTTKNETSQTTAQCAIQNIVCSACKHWGGQGTIGIVTHTEGDYRPCMAYLFGDMDNENFKPMPDWKVTFGCLNGAKGVLEVHKDFGCVNYNADFD